MGNYRKNKLHDYFKCAFCNSNQNLSDKRAQFEPEPESNKKLFFKLICWYCSNCWELNITKIENLYSLDKDTYEHIIAHYGNNKKVKNIFENFVDKYNLFENKINEKEITEIMNQTGLSLHELYCGVQITNYINLPNKKFNNYKTVDSELIELLQEYQDNVSLNHRTAIGMLARKILLYLWNSECVAENKIFDSKLNFQEICDELKKSNILGKKQNSDFDAIRKIGNEANHNIIKISDKQLKSLKSVINNLINAFYNEGSNE